MNAEKPPKERTEPRPVDFIRARQYATDAFNDGDRARLHHSINFMEAMYFAGVHPTIALKEYSRIMLDIE